MAKINYIKRIWQKETGHNEARKSWRDTVHNCELRDMNFGYAKRVQVSEKNEQKEWGNK